MFAPRSPAKMNFGAVGPDQKLLIQVRFQKNTEVGQYSDNLSFTPQEYFTLTQQDIDNQIADRVTNWVSIIKNALPAKEPTIEELQSAKDVLQQQLEIVQQQIEDVNQ